MTQWYVFQALSQAEVVHVQKTLKQLGNMHHMNGLILIAEEGCNGTVAGSQDAIAHMKAYLQETFSISNFQDWESDVKPFKRFKVDIRKEIVALKNGTPHSQAQDHLSPKEFHAMMHQEGITVLDARNIYESSIGKFKDAVTPAIERFHEFPGYVATSSIPKDKPVLMYCTSGIRCEKGAQEMRRQGYEKVYQLDGGITNYMKKYPEGNWEGECFMFDHRVAVDSKLKPSKRYSLCPSCGNPGDVRTTCSNCESACILCKYCLSKAPAVCSKACKREIARGEEARV